MLVIFIYSLFLFFFFLFINLNFWKYRVICWSCFPLMVPVWKSEGLWQKRPCCKTLYCSASFTICYISWNFSNWWLLASLDRCIHWIDYRFVEVIHDNELCYNEKYYSLTSLFFGTYRKRGCLFMLPTFLPIPSWCQWYSLQNRMIS